MSIIVLSERTAEPAVWDFMAAYRTTRKKFHGKLFRVGDRAVVHGLLSQWRRANPGRQLLVVYEENLVSTAFSKAVNPSWFLEGVADQILMGKEAKGLRPPRGEPLYSAQIFDLWRRLRGSAPLHTKLRPPADSLEYADTIFRGLHLPARFIACQPLYDAPYDKHRNAPPVWWADVFRRIAREAPVALLGPRQSMDLVNVPGAYGLWPHERNAMDSLTFASRAAVFVGGDTGVPHWAAVFSVPLVSCQTYWDIQWSNNRLRHMDVRPISFGAPVVHARLRGDPEETAYKALELWRRPPAS